MSSDAQPHSGASVGVAKNNGVALPRSPRTASTPMPTTKSTSQGLLGWEVVHPAGTGPTDLASALGSNDSRFDDIRDKKTGQRLEVGVLRSSLQTGPQNLLILPPDVASVIYVLDCSSSMQGDRFNRTQAAIVDAVGQMSAKQQFALLLFNTNALQIRGGGYRSAGLKGASRLQTELQAIEPKGGTDPLDALLLAIQLKPDAVVLLSDGEFTPSVVDQVTQQNRSGGKNTQINCMAIGSHVRTLQRLATMNGPGNYVEVP
ncbi:von Willebrand factor type A domain protein [Novipirellula galeiformis]|uniref:von Willebrand factor type A domain protein n=1 Tax=Novipirellula galeiformis TaxID=2528004 RepID=A0A5C6CTM0_9BACT|nr:vWA domain-containing protein [Novipirellula galeiformis]TWU26771.1 von Willebrand factor type A domain protein [Novipirellula galeiformis]